MVSKDLIVVLNATAMRGTMNLYISQLAAAGIDYHIEWMLNYPAGGGTLQHKVDLFRKMTDKFSDYDKIVFSDSFDVTFYGTKEDMLSKIPSGVMFAAEKNCYPDSTIASKIKGDTPWKYCNGGLTCGSVDGIRQWTRDIVKHPMYSPNALDQDVLNKLRVEASPLAIVDETTTLFFCLYGGYPELEFEKGIPVNTLCNTRPQFLHRNGQWSGDEMFAKCERSLL